MITLLKKENKFNIVQMHKYFLIFLLPFLLLNTGLCQSDEISYEFCGVSIITCNDSNKIKTIELFIKITNNSFYEIEKWAGGNENLHMNLALLDTVFIPYYGFQPLIIKPFEYEYMNLRIKWQDNLFFQSEAKNYKRVEDIVDSIFIYRENNGIKELIIRSTNFTIRNHKYFDCELFDLEWWTDL